MGDFGSITVANDRMGMGRITGLEPWASDAKWDGTPSKRKSYLEDDMLGKIADSSPELAAAAVAAAAMCP